MHFQIQTLLFQAILQTIRSLSERFASSLLHCPHPPPQFELRYLIHDTQEVTQEGNGGSIYFESLQWRLTCKRIMVGRSETS
jgi:hypothetical protein